jgi:predicted enzyme related to lactoylglutathione lyase
VLEVDDCRKTFAELKARGVKFTDPQPREEGWGFAADLVDPDGNHFTIHETRKAAASADWAKAGKKA